MGACPRFTSFVAMVRMVRTSAMISTIASIVAVVDMVLVYISSRWKKRSMRLKTSISLSRLEPTSIAAWGPLGVKIGHAREPSMDDTDRYDDANPHKICVYQWKCLKVKALEQEFFFTRKNLDDIHRPNALALAEGGTNRVYL